MQKIKNVFSKMSTCFNVKSDTNSLLYSRCLLYVVLLLSLINLFYLINVKSTTTIIVFFLVGFLTSFFVKNMIIVIVFAMFVAWLFEGLAKPSAKNYLENFAGKDSKESKENFKFDYQGQAQGDNGSSKEDEEEEEEEKSEKPKNAKAPSVKSKSKEDDKKAPSMPAGGKTSELKKDMEEYFDIQKQLLDLLAQAEPLQKKAEVFKEKFNNK